MSSRSFTTPYHLQQRRRWSESSVSQRAIILLTFSRSLSPECTPLKHRYDQCFNSWFEGYLQPALDAAHTSQTNPPQPPQSSSPIFTTPIIPVEGEAGPSKLKPVVDQRKRIITNWSNAFPTRTHSTNPVPGTGENEARGGYVHQYGNQARETFEPLTDAEILDNKGKTRTQLKAEQYERECGAAWRDYQKCLKVS